MNWYYIFYYTLQKENTLFKKQSFLRIKLHKTKILKKELSKERKKIK